MKKCLAILVVCLVSALASAQTFNLGTNPFQAVNLGTTPNDGTGDTLRAAFGKTNGDFAALDEALNGDPDVEDYLTRLNAVSSISTSQQTGILHFVLEAKAHRYWPKMLEIAPFAGNTLAGGLVKLKPYPKAPASLSNNGFVAADYSAEGLQGGAGKYLDSGFCYADWGSTLLLGMSVYVNDEYIGTTVECWAGLDNGQGAPLFSISALPYPSYGVQFGDGNGTPNIIGNAAFGRGLFHYERPSLSSAKAFLNGSLVWANSTLQADGPHYLTHTIFGGAGAPTANPMLHRLSFEALDDGTMTRTEAAYFGSDVRQLQLELGRSAPPASALRMIPIIGQSLAGGANGAPPLSVTQPFSNRQFIDYGPGLNYNPATHYPLTLVPMREVGQETIASGGANLQSQLWRVDHPNDASQDLLIGNYALGGAPYSYLAKGGPHGFAESISDVITANKLAPFYGNGFAVPSIWCVHGETDAASPTYQADLTQWQSDYQAAINGVTGRNDTIPMLVSQPSAWTTASNLNAPTSLSPYAIVAAWKANPTKIIPVCAKYIEPYGVSPNDIHLTNNGYLWLGEYYGKFQDKLNRGQVPVPLYPGAITRNGAVITVTMSGSVGNLALDTSLVTDPGNYGFEWFQTGGTTRTIQSVAVGTGNTVVITLSGDPGSSVNRLRYAYTGIAGNSGGPTTGPRGCLRDSDPTVSRSGHPLYNYCLHFDEPCP